MYFAHTSVSADLILYKGLLDKYLQDQTNEKVNQLFEDIIITTHMLITNKIKESDVDHKVFNLVVELSDHKKEFTRRYFEQINPANIRLEDFQTLSNILNSLISASENEA